MSTVEHEVIDPRFAGLADASASIHDSIVNEDTRFGEVEDMRAMRFGYNPGWKMVMDPTITGRQLQRLEPGQLLRFQTTPISRQNPSVDAMDNKPPSIMSELLAGEAFYATYEQHNKLGFREITPLRGKEYFAALRAFYQVHKPLAEYAGQTFGDGEQAVVIKPCPNREDTDVCITCRLVILQAMKKAGGLDALQTAMVDILIDGIGQARREMKTQWDGWVSEVGGRKAGTSKAGLEALRGNHFFFMKQLHERSPEEAELVKIGLSAQVQAESLERALAIQGERFAQVIASSQQNPSAAAEAAELRATIAQMQEQMAGLMEMVKAGQATEAVPGSPAPTKTPKSTNKG